MIEKQFYNIAWYGNIVACTVHVQRRMGHWVQQPQRISAME